MFPRKLWFAVFVSMIFLYTTCWFIVWQFTPGAYLSVGAPVRIRVRHVASLVEMERVQAVWLRALTKVWCLGRVGNFSGIQCGPFHQKTA